MRTIGLTPLVQVQIISAYAAPMLQILAAPADPAWNVAGAFYLPATTLASLDVIGVVSGAGLTMNVRLFDLTLALPVDGSEVSITATIDTRAVSNPVNLIGGHLYQIQVEVIGSSGFGLFLTGTLS